MSYVLTQAARLLLAVLALSVLPWWPGLAQAQAARDPAIRLLVGFAPGGGNDTFARLVAQPISEALGRQLVVENKAGAAGLIATDFVAKSEPNGSTLLMGSLGQQIFLPLLRKDLPYDNDKDLQPVSLLVRSGMVLAVRNDLPVNSVQELVALAKQQPGKLSFGSGGHAGTLHVAAELLQLQGGIELLHVPYKGNVPALNALTSGEIDILFSESTVIRPFEEAGRVRVLAVTTPQRIPGRDSIPTVAESGYPGFDVSGWYGLYVAAGTPQATVEALSEAAQAALQSPTLRAQLAERGLIAVGNTPEAFRAQLQVEQQRWREVFAVAGLSEKDR